MSMIIVITLVVRTLLMTITLVVRTLLMTWLYHVDLDLLSADQVVNTCFV